MKKIFFFFWISISGLLAQTKTPITLDWMLSQEPATLTALPMTQWFDDGSLLLYDTRLPMNQRTFEKYHPVKDQKTPWIDNQKAIHALTAVLGDDAPKSLFWPLAFDARGEKALYLIQNDIWVLLLPQSEWLRITHTEEEEKSPRFAPDGNAIAYIRDNNLYVYDLNASREFSLTSDGSSTILNGTLSWVYWEEIFNREDLGYWWSPDSRNIAYLQTDESMVTLVRWIDFQPVVPREILQRYPKAGEPNPKVRVGVVGVHNAKTQWIDFPDDPYEYIVRVQWLPDGRRLAVQTMNRLQTELRLYFADIQTGQPTLILTEKDTTWINEHDDLHFLKNGREFLWTSERTGYNHIYRYTLDGKLVNPLTQGQWAVRSSGRGEAIVAIDEKTGWVYFTAQEKSSVEKHLYRVRMDGKNLQRLTTNEGVHQVRFSPDLNYYIDRFSSMTMLPGLYLHKKDGKLQKTLSPPQNEKLQSLAIRFPKYFTIPARDGFPMPALLYKPVQFDSTKRYPLIFYVYGGPSAPEVHKGWHRYFWYNQVLNNEGYVVTIVDNRSATAISKILETTVMYQQAGDGELNDLIDAVRWYKAQPWIDSNRIGIWGVSGGGQFTMMALSRTREFKAGITVAGGTDWRYYDTKYTERTMKTPQINPDGYARTSLIPHAKNLSGRLLIIHGTYDDNVHPQHVWHFIDELIKANKKFDMMFYPMRKHGIGDRPGRIHYFHTMLDFWKNNL